MVAEGVVTKLDQHGNQLKFEVSTVDTCASFLVIVLCVCVCVCVLVSCRIPHLKVMSCCIT